MVTSIHFLWCFIEDETMKWLALVGVLLEYIVIDELLLLLAGKRVSVLQHPWKAVHHPRCNHDKFSKEQPRAYHIIVWSSWMVWKRSFEFYTFWTGFIWQDVSFLFVHFIFMSRDLINIIVISVVCLLGSLLFQLLVQKMASGWLANNSLQCANPEDMVWYGNLHMIKVFSSGSMVMEERVQLSAKSGAYKICVCNWCFFFPLVLELLRIN